MAAPSNRLLRNILRALVEEYGHKEVNLTLDKIITKNESDYLLSERVKISRSNRNISDNVISNKPTAVDQVNSFASVSRDRDALLKLAYRFDRKEFLPTVNNVIEFLEKMGGGNETVRDRMDGFRHVLLFLSKLPSDRLKALANVNSPSGPAQLAPLAEAIRSAGDAMRRGANASHSDFEPKSREKSDAAVSRELTKDVEKASEAKVHTKAERARPRVGRQARRQGAVEAVAASAPARGAFPASGGISYGPWGDLAREHLPLPLPDLDRVAGDFRRWAAERDLALSSGQVEKAFIDFCRKVGPAR